MLLDQRKTEDISNLLRALGHPLRLRIAALLDVGEMHVGAIAERLDAPPPIVSQQLRILRMSGVVAATRNDGHAVYRLIQPQVTQLLRCMEAHAQGSQEQP